MEIVRRLRAAGWETYLVGGVVRDLLLDRAPADLDLVTAAPPEVISTLFDRTIPVGAEFAVVAVVLEGHPYQVATFRREGPYLDGRRPAYVEQADATADVQRRDFTINALLYDPIDDRLIDHVGGRADLARRVIRTVGDPWARLAEDRLRMLRAVRLAAELGFAIDASTLEAITALAGTVVTVSAERIREELVKLLVAPGRAEAMWLLVRTGLLAAILPEVATLAGRRTSPTTAAGVDGLTQTCMALQQLSRPTTELAMATVLHHLESPPQVEELCRRLRFPNAEARTIAALVENLPRVSRLPGMPLHEVRALLERLPVADLLELSRVDALARSADLALYRRVAGVVAGLGGPSSRPRILSGEDLIALGYEPGPQFAGILEAVDRARSRGDIVTPDEARSWVLGHFPAGHPSGPTEPFTGLDSGRNQGGQGCQSGRRS
ncbi:MAG: CCA tRNA nucleotidyltransferase [Armatimonadota bacterium]